MYIQAYTQSALLLAISPLQTDNLSLTHQSVCSSDQKIQPTPQALHCSDPTISQFFIELGVSKQVCIYTCIYTQRKGGLDLPHDASATPSSPATSQVAMRETPCSR